MKVSKPDWVGIRALYLLLASDTSAALSPEVQRIIRYYREKYSTEIFYPAMAAIARDNAWRNTFSDPQVAFARKINQSIHVTQRDEEFLEKIRDITKEKP
jgi:hypothetical protein